MISRVKEWLERFTADEPTPEEIMELRAREGTLLDDLHDAKEGVKGVLHELTEPDEDDYVYACYDNQGLDEMIEDENDSFEEDDSFDHLIATGKIPPTVCAIGIGLGFDEED